MISENRAGDARAKLDALRARGHGTEPGPDEARLAFLGPRMKMVARLDGIESRLLGADGVFEELLRRVLLRAGFPAEFNVGHASILAVTPKTLKTGISFIRVTFRVAAKPAAEFSFLAKDGKLHLYLAFDGAGFLHRRVRAAARAC